MDCCGIDLGTSNCLIAKITQRLDDSFEIKCLSNLDGEESFPSVVYFEDDKTYKVGKVALKKLIEQPDSTIELIKIRLGKTSQIRVNTPDLSFEKSPQEISSYMLKHFDKFCETNILDAVVTVPAFFGQSEKDATMQAGKLAEIEVLSLIEEPTAAIMYHIFQLYSENGIEWLSTQGQKNILVFDFGGGTLDLSLIDVHYLNDEVVPSVLKVGGDTTLGGNLIDFIFTKMVIEFLRENYPDDLFIEEVQIAYKEYFDSYIKGEKLRFSNSVSLDVKQFIFRLKRNLEQVKKKLSTQEETNIVLEGKYRQIPINRKNFEKSVLMCDELNIRDKIESALVQISRARKRVDEVLLIGGSSQIPFVKEVILEAFADMGVTKDLIFVCDDFEKAVAKGAAIQSAILKGVQIPPFMNNKCYSVVARDIEISHSGNCKTLVPSGTPYPLEKKVSYDIEIGHSLAEKINLRLNEIVVNDDKEKKTNEICDFQFYLPVYYTNDVINVALNIDEAGLYQIEAVHHKTKETVEFEPNKRYSLSDSDLEKALTTGKNMKDVT